MRNAVVTVAAVAALVLASCGATSRRVAGSSHGAPGACVPTPIQTGAPPSWSNPAWSLSSGPVKMSYALVSDNAALAVLAADSLRAGHPTNPHNKVLWVVRFSRHGHPLRITARQGSHVVRLLARANSSPGEIYPSYVDLPSPGCWKLALVWGRHRGSINVDVMPAAL